MNEMSENLSTFVRFGLICAVCVLVVQAANAQDDERRPVAAEAKAKLLESKPKLFDGAKGSVIIVGSEEIAKIEGSGSLTLIAHEFIAGETGKKEWGVEILVHQIHSALTDGERWSSISVPYEEIEPMIKGIDYISEVDASAIKLKHFEATYSNKNGLKISKGIVFDSMTNGEKMRYQVSVNDAVFFGDLNAIRDAVLQAKEKLGSLQKEEIKK